MHTNADIWFAMIVEALSVKCVIAKTLGSRYRDHIVPSLSIIKLKLRLTLMLFSHDFFIFASNY